ncbi:MAG: PilZ domain-containing protein [Nitrospiraceae bacterium]|nr:PilZ domain-containing protein [Nitrospiraceae bacterium]
MDHRRHPRFAVQFRSSFSSANLVGGEGSLLDLSLRGCRIFSTTAVLPGTTLQLQVHLSENAPPLTIDQGIVRWCRDKHFGLEFSTLKPDEWARLQQTVKVLEQQPYEQGEET